MKYVVRWSVWWVALFWLWFLLVGEWNLQELVAAAAGAAVAATIGEAARARASVRVRVPLHRLARAKSVPLMIVVDFAVIVAALVRSIVGREVVRGAFTSREFPAGGDDPESVGIRAWATMTRTYSPNAYVVEIEQERGLVLLHDLVPRRSLDPPL